ncbi:uncharacterized protein BDR25DRAFT_326143 [Lindgomyces ingoldianus]|uniref:Uncharacterized protein n=1 Tax=Lindgomyces ingoldianus TaxID=673940 RepID=A0ACB6QT19_9PLEO|nr:uncharacterized protein BDR25DRAFT_326143 [Lindgomyces ingoldianus]KAF2469237.1 hypothetical protein BDR25DRAFT_326143 [Lindgomyces ingoldianus]
MMLLDSTEKDLSLQPPFRTELLRSVSRQDGAELLIPLLPATYRDRYVVRLVNADVLAYLKSELDLKRLNRVHNWLWIVGLPSPPRPLHMQRLKGRDIIVAEQLDLHLVWSPTQVFIKPLPRFLLSARFWQSDICPHYHLYQTALGFLLTYVALIEREVDFNLAVSLGLLPSELTWPGWLSLVEEVVFTSSEANSYFSDPASLSHLEPHVPVNPRFYYGELRLGRLNWIYRLLLGSPRGYLSGCTTYGAFIRDNVNSLITLFAYTTIVLSAMQVGLSTNLLADNYGFSMASYVFSIFAILAPLSAISAIIFLFLILFVVNLVRTLGVRQKRRRQGAGV